MKKQSNPLPPKGAIKPDPPPAPPQKMQHAILCRCDETGVHRIGRVDFEDDLIALLDRCRPFLTIMKNDLKNKASVTMEYTTARLSKEVDELLDKINDVIDKEQEKP
jgi:hypothetical protein